MVSCQNPLFRQIKLGLRRNESGLDVCVFFFTWGFSTYPQCLMRRLYRKTLFPQRVPKTVLPFNHSETKKETAPLMVGRAVNTSFTVNPFHALLARSLRSSSKSSLLFSTSRRIRLRMNLETGRAARRAKSLMSSSSSPG